MRKRILVVIIVLLTSTVHAFENPFFEQGYKYLNLSPDGTTIAYAKEGQASLFITRLSTRITTKIESGLNSAMQTSWSADSRFLGFKYFQESSGIRLQIPALLDVASGTVLPLSEPVRNCGIPSISNTGLVAFSVDKRIIIMNMQREIIREYAVDDYANQTPISPDGSRLLYNDNDDRMRLWNLDSNTDEHIALPEGGYFEPIWSPDNRHLVFSSLSRKLFIYDLRENKTLPLGEGQNATWSPDGQALAFCQTEFTEATSLDLSRLVYFNINGQRSVINESAIKMLDYPVFDSNGQIIVSDRAGGSLYTSGSLHTLQKQSVNFDELQIEEASAEIFLPVLNYLPKTMSTAEEDVFDIPYVNQRYDTPDEYNGNSACGATSAIMCIAYYGLVNPWPETVSWPYSHTSYFGNYIMKKYTHNGYTFNIWATDPNGKKGYGGFGHIVRNNPAWADTKGNMADYAIKHGLSSGVDWSPTRTKIKTEVGKRMPLVLLNSLTSSGHYISVIGYKNNGNTIIVNDPYGNKNNGYANFYGQRSAYDWPGYNNGNENLNTVWCYIYFRGTVPGYCDLETVSTSITDTIQPGQNFAYTVTVFNYGDSSSAHTTGRLDFVDLDENRSQYAVVDIPALSAGDSAQFSFNVQLADSLVSGTNYYLEFTADPEYKNEEMVWDNNSVKSNLIVEGYPHIYYHYPTAGEQITTMNPTIKASYRSNVSLLIPDSVKIYVDGRDTTLYSDVSGRSVKFTAHEGLDIGFHQVEVHVLNEAGFKSKLQWGFEVVDETAIDDKSSQQPVDFVLRQNYPNPFNNSTRISFYIPRNGTVSLKIYDTMGRLVKTLTDAQLSAGEHSYVWNGSDNNNRLSASGIYLLSFEWNQKQAIQRLLLIK